MTMHRVYERLHCVLNLISDILYALKREDLANYVIHRKNT